MPIIRFSLDNPILVNLGLVIILIMGVLAWRALPQEIFPVVELDMVSIVTEFEGASPAEVEQQVTLTIEEEFVDSQDIDFITSSSSEGLSSIYIKLKPGSNVDDFINESRTILDRIDNLPDIAKKPELSRILARFPVITLVLYGDLSKAELYDVAEDVRRKMVEIRGVASVGVAGDRDWEIWVEVDPHTLAALRIPLELVMNALSENLRDQPGGSIRSIEGDIRLRGQGVLPEPENIENIVLRINPDGGQLRIGDFANVTRRFEEAQTYARFNGKPSINLTVTKTSDASTIKVSEAIKQLAHDLKRTLPASIYSGYHTDMSVYVKTRLNTVMSSGLIGLILVLLSLYLLINLRVATITAFGIPVSFLFAVILLYYFNFTINMVSLFAFLIVLGMIVDDAIIVTENVYRHIENGMPPMQAAQQGTREVMWPVIVSTFTTIAAFIPMFAIGSTLGEFIKVIPVVVSCALLGSLIEAFVVLPSHTGHFLRQEKNRREGLWWKSLLERYCRLLHWSALNRYTVAVASICVLAITLAYASTRMHFEMFGHVEIGQFFLNVEAPSTYSLEDSLVLSDDIEKTIKEVIGENELETLLTNVGISFIDFNRFRRGSNLLQFVIDLKKPVPEGSIERWVSPLISMEFDNYGTRTRSADDIIDAVRERLLQNPAVQRMYILKTEGGPAGADIEIGIKSADTDMLKNKADEITAWLRRIPGVKDVRHDQETGKMEYKYQLNDHGKRLGMTQSQIANVVRSGYLGNEVVYVTWNEKRIPVRVIFPEPMRQESTSLEELPLVLPTGETVYLSDVAEITVGYDLNQIRRRDRQRMALVTAEVDSKLITANEVINQFQKEYTQDAINNNYKLLFLGEKKDADEAFKGMNQALVIALVVIFFMLTALFKSLLDPLVVMFAIPFGLVGVIFGHVIFGYHIQFLSAVGMLALSGIIVNDSLLLVDFIKNMRAQGKDRITAVVEAGRIRTRPILLTTITTFLGVSPLIFFATGQTAFLSPMAVSLGFGLVFATVLILVALPCFYLIADDARSLFFGKAEADIKDVV